jgi:hypothetical protein
MNPSSDTQIIYPGTIVAQVSPVQEVVNPNSKIDEEGELRTDLINLLEHSQEHLTNLSNVAGAPFNPNDMTRNS